MALVYKAHIQGGSDNTASFPHNHPYISSCKLRLAEISTAISITPPSLAGLGSYVYGIRDTCSLGTCMLIGIQPQLALGWLHNINNCKLDNRAICLASRHWPVITSGAKKVDQSQDSLCVICAWASGDETTLHVITHYRVTVSWSAITPVVNCHFCRVAISNDLLTS